MKIWAIVPFLLLLAIFYTGRRGQQAFARHIPPGGVKVYWAVYLLIVSSSILGRSFESSHPLIKTILTWVGSYSLAFLFYAFFILLLIDLLRLLDRWLGFIPPPIKKSPAKVGLAVIILLAGLLAYGSWNAWNPVITSYDINIDKPANDTKHLHVIMISDLHLGEIVNRERLSEMVKQVNQRNPDLILLGGDIIDGDLGPFLQQNMGTALAQLKPRLGTYAVLGNHDGHGTELIPYLEAAGIIVLNDQYRLIDNSFYLAGTSFGGWHNNGSSQQPLAETMAGVKQELPIILLKHSPVDLEEARINGVDLQLSGHTHQGQLFPNNFITNNMYDADWGYLRQGNLQLVVSTGFGTWGPPIRIGNTPEIVDLRINFKP